MTQVYRVINFDKHTRRFVIDVLFDGENEELVFDNSWDATEAYKQLVADGAVEL